MKKTIVAAVAALSIVGLSACTEAKAEFSPFVGMERATTENTTEAYVGVDTNIAGLDLTTKATFDAKVDNRGDLTLVELDGSYSLTDSTSLYSETDFNKDWTRTETKVGVRVNL